MHPFGAMKHYLMVSVKLFYCNKRCLFLFALDTQTPSSTQSPPPIHMNDLGACALTICHLPWARLRPT